MMKVAITTGKKVRETEKATLYEIPHYYEKEQQEDGHFREIPTWIPKSSILKEDVHYTNTYSALYLKPFVLKETQAPMQGLWNEGTYKPVFELKDVDENGKITMFEDAGKYL